MCFTEFIGYSCGHCSMGVLRPCPLTTSEHRNPVCDLQASRPFLSSEMCPVCSRLMHSRSVLIQEWEHYFLHERGACECEVIFPDLVRPRVIGGESVFKRNEQGGKKQLTQGADAGPATTEGKKAPPIFERFVGPEGRVAYSVRLPSLFAAEWVDDHSELHRKSECKCNADFNRYKPEWAQDGGKSEQQDAGLDGQHSHNNKPEQQATTMEQTKPQEENQEESQDEELIVITYATPVAPSKRPVGRRSVSVDIPVSMTATCYDEDYCDDDVNSSSPAAASSASEAGEPQLHRASRSHRRASSIDARPVSSSLERSQSSPGGGAAGRLGARNPGEYGDFGHTATRNAQKHAPVVAPSRHVTFSDAAQYSRPSDDAAPAGGQEMPPLAPGMLPTPPASEPGLAAEQPAQPNLTTTTTATTAGSAPWGPAIFPSKGDDVFRNSAAGQMQLADSHSQQHPEKQQPQQAPAGASAVYCSRGLRVEDVSGLSSLPPMHYPSGQVELPEGVSATAYPSKAPSCKPIAGLPIGAGPEGKYRHMPPFENCSLKKKYPPGARTRLYN